MGKRLDYRDEVTRRAAECAGELLDGARTGARFPVLPTLNLLKRAWLMGWNSARDRRHQEALKEAAKCSSQP
jgi:hypothetical protein